MKVFVATKQTQGFRPSDFSFTSEKEVVRFGSVCDRDEDIDGTCGCRRSMVGLATRKATTTFMVAEIEITDDDYFRLVRNSYMSSGWPNHLIEDFVKEDIVTLKELTDTFPTGMVLEKRGPIIQERG